MTFTRNCICPTNIKCITSQPTHKTSWFDMPAILVQAITIVMHWIPKPQSW